MLTRIFRLLNQMKIRPSPMGRWCHVDKSKNDWKVDMANTDHCGTCSFDSPKDSPKNIPKINLVKKDNKGPMNN
jgi:hypothetical protein